MHATNALQDTSWNISLIPVLAHFPAAFSHAFLKVSFYWGAGLPPCICAMSIQGLSVPVCVSPPTYRELKWSSQTSEITSAPNSPPSISEWSNRHFLGSYELGRDRCADCFETVRHWLCVWNNINFWDQKWPLTSPVTTEANWYQEQNGIFIP